MSTRRDVLKVLGVGALATTSTGVGAAGSVLHDAHDSGPAVLLPRLEEYRRVAAEELRDLPHEIESVIGEQVSVQIRVVDGFDQPGVLTVGHITVYMTDRLHHVRRGAKELLGWGVPAILNHVLRATPRATDIYIGDELSNLAVRNCRPWAEQDLMERWRITLADAKVVVLRRARELVAGS